MNRYLIIFILSIVYYLMYLFITLQLIPFLSLFTDNTIYSVNLKIGPVPIGYPLMLIVAGLTYFIIDKRRARKKMNGK